MGTQPESRLQKRIQKALEKEFPGSFWRKIHGGMYQRAGIPDLLGCVGSFFIAIEVKCPGKEGTLTSLQGAVIKQIKSSGGIAFVATSVEEALHRSLLYINGKFTGTQLYKTWQNIKSRCYNKNTPYYKNYGGKGIRVCDRWLKGAFFLWQDMGFPPQEEDEDGNAIRYSIDRIDSDKDYTPENCQWLSLSENSGKNSQNRFITYKGLTKTFKEWCSMYNIPRTTLQGRLDRGWSIRRALTTPSDKRFHGKN